MCQGFSNLATELTAFEDGAELLVRSLNDYFQPMIDIVRSYGAKIETFAGDSIIGFFSAESRAMCMHQAVGCIMRLLDLEPLRVVLPDNSKRIMSHYAVLVYGELLGLTTGDCDGQWYHMLYGKPFDALQGVMHDAHQVCSIVLSCSVRQWKNVGAPFPDEHVSLQALSLGADPVGVVPNIAWQKRWVSPKVLATYRSVCQSAKSRKTNCRRSSQR